MSRKTVNRTDNTKSKRSGKKNKTIQCPTEAVNTTKQYNVKK
jgi:hypothetical protein